MIGCDECWYCRNDENACPFYRWGKRWDSGKIDLKEIKKKAHKDPAVAVFFAACLLYGFHMPRDEYKARALLKKLLRTEYVPAMFVFSYWYMVNARNSEIKPEDAFKICEQAAKKGCSSAEVHVYHCYRDGIGVEQDNKQAGEWCTRAVEHGSTEVYHEYAQMCLIPAYGLNNAKNMMKACVCYEELLKGDESYKEQLKEMYFRCAEALCWHDKPGACEYFEKAQQLGHPAALERLVDLHKNHIEECFPKARRFQSDYMLEKGDFCLNNKYAPNATAALNCYRIALKQLTEPKDELKELLDNSWTTTPTQSDYLIRSYYVEKVLGIPQTIAVEKTDEKIFEIKQRIKKCYGRLLAEHPVRKPLYEKAVAGDATTQIELAELFADKTFTLYDLEESLDWYRLAADQGNAVAQNRLGNCYYNGQGVDKSYTEAVKIYRLAADQGNAAAQSNLGMCYYYGNGVAKDYTKAVKWYRLSADQGNAAAQNNLGDCYYYGNGVTKDYAEAVKWYWLAAEQGNAYAQNKLGWCYYYGNGVTKDYAEAVKWYRLSADQGDAVAQNQLGNCYYNGRGVDKSYAEAVKLYRLAADQGNAAAQSNLGMCYYYGNGVAKDYAEAVNWYRLAAEQGDTGAQNNLGACYNNGWGVAQNYSEAVKWYRLAAEQGNSNAQSNLGDCYYYGNGVTKDYAEAVKWYCLAADQGHAGAQSNLGWCYYHGQGVGKNYTEAVKWYRLSADQGNANAQNDLGNRYYHGEGVERNYTEAAKWYTLAAQQGNANAQSALGSCYEDGQGVLQNYAEALKWYTLAAKQGNARAQYSLGNCYYIGSGVERNYSAAYAWFKLAADHGHAEAICGLAILYHYGQGVAQDYSEAIKWYELAVKKGADMAQKLLKICKEAYEKEKQAKEYRETQSRNYTIYENDTDLVGEPIYGVDPPRQLEPTMWFDWRTGERLSRNENGEIVNSQGETVSPAWWE